MTTYEQHLKQLSKRWQQRIVKTNFVMAAVVLIFGIASYYDFCTSVLDVINNSVQVMYETKPNS